MRASIIALPFFFCCASSAYAQSSRPSPVLRTGLAVRYQLSGDSTWTNGRVVLVGNCLALAATAELDSAGSRGGFAGIFFSSVGAVQARRDTSWASVAEAELNALRACKVEP